MHHQSILIAVAVCALATMLAMVRYEMYAPFASDLKDRCRKLSGRDQWNKYYWRQRRNFPDKDPEWQCPEGWQDTGCGIGMGKEFEKKQCRRKMSDTDVSGQVVIEQSGSQCKTDRDCTAPRTCSDYGYCQDAS